MSETPSSTPQLYGRPEVFDFRGRPQLRATVRALMQFIYCNGLGQGDRLPPQEELRIRFGFHNKTLNAAMRIITSFGVVTRKRKAGTIITDPSVVIPDLWRVGVAVMPAVGDVAFFSQLLHKIQGRLRVAGAESSLYLCSEFPVSGPVHFRHFHGLSEALSGGSLDGLVDIKGLEGEDWLAHRKSGLAMTHVGSWEDAPGGVVIEQGAMVETAVRRLKEENCRRLAIVSSGGPKPSYCHFWKSFIGTCAKVGISEANAASLFGGEGPHGGQRVAEQILAMPVSQRPDGMVVIDDRIAMGLTAALAVADGSYRPNIVVQTNRQVPLAFALPVTHYELDIDDLARRAVGHLMAQLRNPHEPLQREWLSPDCYAETALHMIPAEQNATVAVS